MLKRNSQTEASEHTAGQLKGLLYRVYIRVHALKTQSKAEGSAGNSDVYANIQSLLGRACCARGTTVPADCWFAGPRLSPRQIGEPSVGFPSFLRGPSSGALGF